MTLEEFARAFPEKMKELQDFVGGDKIRRIMGIEGVEHFKESFQNEGFTDETFVKWKDVERRDSKSPWYGHSGQTGKFSDARAAAKILTGETGELRNSLSYKLIDLGVRITSPTPYAGVHQFGLPAKIYGKKYFIMPARPFMGRSVVLKNKIEAEIQKEFIKILMGK